jgi:hypothetical protein
VVLVIETPVSDVVIARQQAALVTANGVILRVIVATNASEQTKILTSETATVG